VQERFTLAMAWFIDTHVARAHAGNDMAAYREYRDRSRPMANSRNFEGQIAWAQAME
jgi:hypothetical protein